uniref:Uncharacterized protein n=1 Tax=viral metagenome TaxID=1070528 RepID=A0A6C0BRI6_9ZZZZ
MENLRVRLINIKDFDILSELCCLEENISYAQDIINNINVNITPKNFLSSFIIYNCSHDIIGKNHIDENLDLINTAKNMIFSETYSDLKKYVTKYCHLFEIWKKKDYKLIIDSLCHEFFQTNLSILNIPTNNIEKKMLLTCYRNKIVHYASKLVSSEDVCNILYNYSPLKYTHKELTTKYNKDFFTNLSYQFDSDNFIPFLDVIDFLCDFYITIQNKKIEHIKAIFNRGYFNDILHNNYNNDDIKFFSNKAFDLIKSVQIHDNNTLLEKYRYEVITNSTYLPDIIENIVNLTISLTNNIENMQKN